MRRPSEPFNPGVSLFPFLSVLISTMGAMILLLTIINRHAPLKPATLAEETAAEREAREDLEWRAEHLRASRDKTEQDLARERLRLSGIETHLRELTDRWRNLRATADVLDLAGSAAGGTREAAQAEWERLRAELAEQKTRLDSVRRAARNRPAAFAIIPYDGPYQTNRRPIYLECRADGVVLQPEGIVLKASDFAGPDGPGNPLAAALRAAREILVDRTSDAAEPPSEPYPLLLIRPDGIAAYYAARKAMSSWSSEFGYELIDQNWTLEFPPADPRLAAAENRAVAEARTRLEWIAATSSNRGGNGKRETYRVSPIRGGLVREGGPPLRNDRAISLSAIRTTPVADKGPGTAERGTAGDLRPATGDNGTAADRKQGTGARGSRGNREARTVDQGETVGTELPDLRSPVAHPRAIRSLAETRGVDWGLPSSTAAQVPVTRPVRIECRSDRLTLLADAAGEGEPQVRLGPRTEDSIDLLVAAIRQRVRGWGIAGRGMYWRPQLVLEVGASGEGRFADLDALVDRQRVRCGEERIGHWSFG